MTNREEWLTDGMYELERVLFKPQGETLPVKIRVSCSWASNRNGGKNKAGAVVGECHYPTASADQTTEMVISQSQDDPMEVLAILAHEMVHAIKGSQADHGKLFKRLALAIGLDGKQPDGKLLMTATIPGEAFKQSVQPIIDNLGPYPHASVDLSQRKKQSTRLVKCECTACGYIARTTTKWIDNVGAPLCACNSEPMEVK